MKKVRKKVLVKGIGASAGIANGEVVVIKEISEFRKMKEGTILVCPITTPSWLPIMHKASAIVTDMGGMLSHPAIVCREFGIPAVVGTNTATTALKNGIVVVVDGSEGKVYGEK